MKGIKTFTQIILLPLIILTGVSGNAQIPDPEQGLRADWMRGTYGLNWKPARTENGKSEAEGLDIRPFLEQIKDLRTVDYIQVHLNESSVYSPVHLGPHGLIEALWQGDTREGTPVNLAVPRVSVGRDPLLEIMKDVKAAGLKVMVYANSGNMLKTNDEIPDVSDRFKEWCDTDPRAQAFIDSKPYHRKEGYPDRPYMFCYAEFIIKEYAIRYGDLIDAWLWDTGRTMWQSGGDFNYDADHGVYSEDIEEQRIYQAFADACHAGNPEAAIAYNNSPGDNDMVDNPFTPATYFDDYMFGHPYSGGKFVGDVAQNFFALEWLAQRDGYVHTDDPGNTRTWDDKVVGHWDPPMSTGAWNSGSTPGVPDSIFAEYYGTAILGNGAVSFGIPLVGRYDFREGQLICRDWGMKQLELLDSFLLAEQYAGAPAWARQDTYLPPAYPGQSYSRSLVQGVDFWDPEGDEITDILISESGESPSWLSISQTEPGTWTLNGTPNEIAATEYEFSLQLKDASGETLRQVQLRVVDPDSIKVSSLMVSPGIASLFTDSSQALTALVFPRDASDQRVSWSSSDTAVSTIDHLGMLTAHDTGFAIITATSQDGAFTGECAVTVSAIIPVSGVEVSPDSVFLSTRRETQILSARVLPTDATDQRISWSSSESSVATVNSKGEIMAIAAGSTTITALSLDGGFSDSCRVSVSSDITPNLALRGSASQSSTNFSGEASRAIDGNTDGIYANGSVTHTQAETYPWWELDLGKEYGISDIVIYGRTDDCCKERLSNFTVSVYNSGDTEVHSETFKAYPNPSVSSHAEGVKGQRVRIVLNGSTYALSLAEVQVYESIPPDSIVVSPDSLLLAKIGETDTLFASVFPSNATNKRIGWTSSDSSVVSVNNEGVVTALDTGRVSINATSLFYTCSDQCTVTVATEDSTSTQILKAGTSDADFIVYPNPAANTLHYDSRSLKGAERIAVYSLSGELVIVQESDSPTDHICISKLRRGVYIIKIHGETTVVKRFIKL